jgi:dienelactone hydrolase
MTDLAKLEYVHDGATLTGRLARPKGPGPHPGVLVMYDALGFGDHVARRTRMLAELGYVALATDMYGTGDHTPTHEEVGALFTALQGDPERLRGRVVAGYEALRKVDGVDPARISAIGFCFGGQCVLELARSGVAAASVVSFHGLLTTRFPARAGEVKAKVLALTGALDPYAPAADLAGFEKEMTEADADWQVTVYGRGWHAFTDASVAGRTDAPGIRYDPFIDRLAWAQATEFLDATLRG